MERQLKQLLHLNFFGISNEIDYIIEDNKLKHNKFIPGVKIPIKAKQSMKDRKNILIVLAWNFLTILKKIIQIFQKISLILKI